jgi:hypothetical protein
MVTVIAWIVALAIGAAEIALCFLGTRWLWRNHRKVRRHFRRLTLPTRVLILVIGGGGVLLAVSDFFFPSGNAEGAHIAAVVIVWTVFATSVLIGIDLAGQAAWRAFQAHLGKAS